MITNHLSDIILLLIMLVGLFRLGFHEAGVCGLGHFMWRQVGLSRFSLVVVFSVTFLSINTFPVRKGLIWLVLAIIAEVPPLVSEANSMHPPPPFIVKLHSQVLIYMNLSGSLPFRPVR
jgi:hypothetical protein